MSPLHSLFGFMRNQKPNHVLIKDGRVRSYMCQIESIPDIYFDPNVHSSFRARVTSDAQCAMHPPCASVSELQMLVCIVQTVNCSGWYCSPHPLTLFNLDPARNATRNSIGFAIVRRPLLQTLCSTVQLTTVPVSLSITICCKTN